MRPITFALPLIAGLMAAAPVLADPAAVNVTLGPDLQERVEALGAREVAQQTDRLAQVVRGALAREGALDGATIDLVLTDLKPNRPTFEQVSRNPGLDVIRSRSIGGAAIEGRITTASGEVLPVRYDWFSNNIEDVLGYTTWQDADMAYRRLADRLADGRYVTR